MAINKISNTPVAVDWYGSLALRQMRHQSHGNCVMQPDGTLWVAVPDPGDVLSVYRSEDRGYSWSRILYATSVPQRWHTTGTTKGPLNFILIDEQYRRFDLIAVEWESTGSTYDINRSRYDLEDMTSSPANTLIDSLPEASQGVIDIAYSHRNAVLVFNDGSANIGARLLSPRSTAVSGATDDADAVAPGPGPATIVDEDGLAYCAYTQTGGNILRFNIFASSPVGGAWGTPVSVHDLGQVDRWADDVVISIDGLGNLCIAYANRDTSAGTIALTYATSIDSGANWDVNTVTRESGYEAYIEPVNTLPTMYVDMIASSQGGFIITYTEKETADGLGHTFVRALTTSDSGATYDLGDQKEIGTKYDGRDVVGGHFFRPTTIKLLDLSDPGMARIAYTVDEGTDSDGDDDMSPVTLAQELLSEVAFVSQLTSDTGTYTQDTAASNELLVSFNITGSPQDNVDFYALGMTGNETTKYLGAFTKIGTNARFLRHEPSASNFMNDRSAYGAATESRSFAIFDPVSYSFPVPEIDITGVDSWIERDTRKIFLPPDFHLARTFVVNKGGYLKRTVWLTEFDGNQYEISQVVPRFISNQICYYEANAFVVGPSRDPFSRTVLPSET